MHPLRVEIDDLTLLFGPERVVTVGRSPAADVALHAAACSRRHAELRPGPDGWQLVDTDSSQGTFIDGHRIQQVAVQGRLAVRFGPTDAGIHVVLTPMAQDEPIRPSAADLSNLATMLPPATGQQTLRDTDLVVRWDGQDHFFTSSAVVHIGRDHRADVVTGHPSASREHAWLRHDADGWLYVDASNSGTYVHGRRVQLLRLTEPTALRLGDPMTGAEILLTPVGPPPGARPRSRSGRPVLVTLAVVLCLVIVGLVVWGTTGYVGEDDPATPPAASATEDSDDRLSSDELEDAKRATVLLEATTVDAQGRPVGYFGSGSIISPDGMILTNAHVATPQAPGLAEIYGPTDIQDPDHLLVSLTSVTDDMPVAASYRARPVVTDGELDAAVIQIYATADGEDLPEDLDLPTLVVGDSGDLETGDELTILGFPGISDSRALSVTRGLVSTFVPDPGLGTDRAEIDTDARIASGNSGGAALDGRGELVGIPSATRGEDGSPVVSGRIRPIDLVKPLISEAADG